MTLELAPLPDEPGFFERHPNWTPDWKPFLLLPSGERGKSPRSIQSKEGIGDRLRSAAFAEIQAYYAFLWASERFHDASPALKANWRGLALAEERHLIWLLRRMEELGIPLEDRAVSDFLWESLTSCKTAEAFSLFMASSEERGRVAGMRFQEALQAIDPVTAEIFGKIAEEEVEHIRLAVKFYPEEAKKHLQGSPALL
jgi:uncharacterized ferritin-like protein (DUF455 family)